MVIQEVYLNTQESVESYLCDLAAMLYRKELKVLSGSLDSTAIIQCTFIEKATGHQWSISGVNDNHGGLACRRAY